MKFVRTSLDGVWLIHAEPREDSRGYFARVYCRDEFAREGLNTEWPQCNVSYNSTKGILRGLHYQADPKPEIKLVRCESGAIFDVVVDVREGSPTRGRWEAFELTAGALTMLYIPGGFAHGFQCLEDRTRVFYQMSEVYYPDLARGVRWNDPRLNIPWPMKEPVMSDRDRELPLLFHE